MGHRGRQNSLRRSDFMGHAMKLLVVEDENKTADYVRQGLMEAGFVVDLARNGLDGHHLAMSETYDLVVLDVMLPDVDGWRIVRSLRDAGKQVPVLFLWDMNFDSDSNVIDVAIRRLRAKIDDAFNPKLN